MIVEKKQRGLVTICNEAPLSAHRTNKPRPRLRERSLIPVRF